MQREQSALRNTGIEKRLRSALRHCRNPGDAVGNIQALYVTLPEDQRIDLLFAMMVELDAALVIARQERQRPHNEELAE
jgi:hypothetical protein